MKKSNIVILFLFSVMAIAFIAVNFLYSWAMSNKNLSALSYDPKINTVAPATEVVLPPEPSLALLDWKQATPQAAWEARDSQAVVVYKEKMWLMGGLNANKHVVSVGDVDYGNAPHFSDVWVSEDGANWSLVLNNAPWGDRRSMAVVDFKGKMWLLGGWGPKVGYRSDVWSSENGADWKLETSSAAWPAREGHQLVVFQNKIWLIGGVKYEGHKLFTDVWFSADGVNWTEATNTTGWSPRWDHSSAVFNNKIWTVGGMDFAGNLFNDVWSSEDGVDWKLVGDNPPFATRQGCGLVDYKNKLWLVSRLNMPLYGNGPNDVWFSADGVNWQKTDKDPQWTGREDIGVIVYKDKIWVIAGMDKNWKWTNDVWYSSF